MQSTFVIRYGALDQYVNGRLSPRGQLLFGPAPSAKRFTSIPQASAWLVANGARTDARVRIVPLVGR